MAKAINTEFDNTVEEDVILELIEGKEPAVATTLKNSENIYKSFLYIKKMYAGSLSSAKVLSVGNVDVSEFETIVVPNGTQDVRLSNTSTAMSQIKINGGMYVMQPGEVLELPIVHPNTNTTPVVAGDLLQLNGKISYILYVKSVV